VTWCSVRGFDTTRVISTQLTLLPDGAIELKYASATGALADAVVGVSPGRTGSFTPVNLADAGPNGGTGAVGERFAAQPLLDTVALLRKFYLTHPDNYDQVVIWTDAPLVQDAFAYEVTVANEISGIGQALFDASRDFGSSGRLRSTAVMDWIDKYPDDPAQRVLGENSTLSVLAHESGHRWLALFEFRDHTGTRSDALLGRQLAHWSFFFDSDASVMEGNDIEDLGGGSFRTVDTVRRYSLLDQYAMGLVGSSQVPTMFYVQSPANMSSSRTRESAPQTGISFNGTRRDVLIEDIIAVEGVRSPSVPDSSKVHRQAFIFLSSAGRTPAPSAIGKVDRIRTQWEPFFGQATDGRMVVTTTLR
jgi:large repetitive protein